MSAQAARIHCELGPLLVNRTAVYRLCKALPGELIRREFRVSCGALLARLRACDVQPSSGAEDRWLDHSRRLLHGALASPRWFLRSAWAWQQLLALRVPVGRILLMD